MNTVLVTGFEPFGGESVNPSALAAQALHGREICGRRVTGTVLPCIFGKSLAALRLEIQQLRPELVICTGQNGGSAEISVERIAINFIHADIPDNAGNQPAAQPALRTGPVAYRSTLPTDAIVAALRHARISAHASVCAGTFVCNYIFYGLMRTLARTRSKRGGFIHVPYLPEQARRAGDGSPSMALEEIIRGLEIAIETSLPAESPDNPRPVAALR